MNALSQICASEYFKASLKFSISNCSAFTFFFINITSCIKKNAEDIIIKNKYLTKIFTNFYLLLKDRFFILLFYSKYTI